MGIQDREYYRRATSGSAWWVAVPPVTRALIIINVVVFLLLQLSRDEASTLFDWFAASPASTLHKLRLWQLLSATFLHVGLPHIVGNMYFLWIVGREMEALHGSRDFLAFYLIAAVVSTLACVVIQDMRGDSLGMVGASGAVLAVVTLYTLYYPFREMLFLFFVPMPMWIVLGICLLYPFLPLPGLGLHKIAVESHLAGAFFGWGYKQFDLRLSRLFSGRGFKPRLKIFSPAASESNVKRSPAATSWTNTSPGPIVKPTVSFLPEEQLDAQLDLVLAKIARDGRGSLTEEEQRVLQEASRRAQRRRSDRP